MAKHAPREVQMTPEEAAEHQFKLRDYDPVKAVQFAQLYEDGAVEQDYDDYLYALDKLNTYGTC